MPLASPPMERSRPGEPTREGQLGDGTTNESDVPVAVDAPEGVTFSAIAAGSSDSLALSTTGQVYAWGSNLLGQLGNGSTTGSDVPVPIDTPDGVTFSAIAAGGDHSLALEFDRRRLRLGGQLRRTTGQRHDDLFGCARPEHRSGRRDLLGHRRRHRIQPGSDCRRPGLRVGLQRLGPAGRRYR